MDNLIFKITNFLYQSQIFDVIFQSGTCLFWSTYLISNQNQLFSDIKYLKIAGVPGFCPGILPARFRESHGFQLHWSVLQTLIKQWPTYIFPNSSKPSSSQNFWVMPWSCTPFGPAVTAGCCQIHIFYCNLTADTMYALIRFVLYDNGVIFH